MQSELQVRLTILPEGTYNSQVHAAALANDLPDQRIYLFDEQGRAI